MDTFNALGASSNSSGDHNQELNPQPLDLSFLDEPLLLPTATEPASIYNITIDDCASLIIKLSTTVVDDQYLAAVAHHSLHLMDENTKTLLTSPLFWQRLRNCPEEVLRNYTLLRELREADTNWHKNTFIFLRPPFLCFNRGKEKDTSPYIEVSLCNACPKRFALETITRRLENYLDDDYNTSLSNEFINLDQFWERIEKDNLSEEFLKALFSQDLIRQVINNIDNADLAFRRRRVSEDQEPRCLAIIEKLKAWQQKYSSPDQFVKTLRPPRAKPNVSSLGIGNFDSQQTAALVPALQNHTFTPLNFPPANPYGLPLVGDIPGLEELQSIDDLPLLDGLSSFEDPQLFEEPPLLPQFEELFHSADAAEQPPFQDTAQTVHSFIPMIEETPTESKHIKFLSKLINNIDTGKTLDEYKQAFQEAGDIIFDILLDKRTEVLFDHIKSNNLTWTIDLSDEAFDSLIMPIIKKIAESKLNADQKLLILAAFIQYFNITNKTGIPYHQGTLSFKKNDIEGVLKNSFIKLLSEVRAKFPPIELPASGLSDQQCVEAGYTFIQMKIWEFQILQKTGHWGLACQGELRNKPIYLIAQDGTEAKLLPYTGIFRGDTLVSITNTTQNEFEANLQNCLGQDFFNEIDLGDGHFNLTSQQLTEFKSKISENKATSPYVLPRLQFALKDEEIKFRKKRELTEGPQQERARRTRVEQPLAAINEIESESTEQLLLRLASEEKGKRKVSEFLLEESASTTSSSSYSAPDNPFRIANKLYKPLDDGQTLQPVRKKQRKLNADAEGDSIAAGTQQKLLSDEEINLSVTQLSQLFEKATEMALNSTVSDASATEAKFKLYNEKIPFESPLVIPLSRVTEQKPANCLPILKPYQKRALAILKGLEKERINGLLSMEMGTGKSLVMMARIIDAIAQGTVGNFVVLLPLSVVGNFENEALRALYEAKSHAMRSVITNTNIVQQELRPFLTTISDYFNKNKPSQAETCQTMFLLRAYAMGVQAKTKEPIQYHAFAPAPFKDKPDALLKLCASHLNFQAIGTRNNQEKYEAIVTQVQTIKSALRDPSLQQVCDRLTTFFKEKTFSLDEVWAEVAQTSVNNPEEMLYLVGALLNLQPEADVELIDQQKAKNILAFPFAKILQVSKAAKLEEVLQSNPLSSQIVISSHTCGNKAFDNNSQLFSNTSLLIVDEAQFAHTATSQSAKWVEALGQYLKTRGIPLWLVTATPCENNYLEALQLLIAANPEALSKEDIDAISSFYAKTITQIGKKKACETSGKTPQLPISQEAVTTSFSQFVALAKIVQQTFVIIKKDSPEVSQAWDGQVAIPKHVVIIKDLPEEKRALLRAVEKTGNLFKRETATKKALLGGNLANLQADSKENRELLTQLQANPEELERFIQNSPQLEAILNTDSLAQAIRDKKKILLIVSNVLVGKIGMLALKHKFGLGDDDVALYSGELTSGEERDEKVRWFKEDSTSTKAMFLSIDAGGVGLNLPEADILIDLTFEYNPAKLNQAFARAFRVFGGTTKEKEIVRVFFTNVYLQLHQQIICDLKSLWSEFLLNQTVDLAKKFDIYKQILILEHKKACLNETMDAIKANNQADIVSNNLSTLSKSMPIPYLQQMVDFFTIIAPKETQPVPVAQATVAPVVTTLPEYRDDLSLSTKRMKFDILDQALNFAAFARVLMPTDGARVFNALENPGGAEFQKLVKLADQAKLYTKNPQKYQVLEFTRDVKGFSANPNQVKDQSKEALRIEKREIEGKQTFTVLLK